MWKTGGDALTHRFPCPTGRQHLRWIVLQSAARSPLAFWGREAVAQAVVEELVQVAEDSVAVLAAFVVLHVQSLHQ